MLRSLNFFLKVVHHGMGPQEAIDFPSFSSSHFPSSFGGSAQPLVLGLEGRLPAATAARLEALGHKVCRGAWTRPLHLSARNSSEPRLCLGSQFTEMTHLVEPRHNLVVSGGELEGARSCRVASSSTLTARASAENGACTRVTLGRT